METIAGRRSAASTGNRLHLTELLDDQHGAARALEPAQAPVDSLSRLPRRQPRDRRHSSWELQCTMTTGCRIPGLTARCSLDSRQR
jgi:hypothetical protein